MFSLHLPSPLRVLIWLKILVLTCLLSLSSAYAEEEYLEPQEAFKFSASMQDGQTILVKFQVAKGYYLYREKLKFAASGANLGAIQLPAGKVKYDETFQKDVETYRDTLQISIPVQGAGPFTLNVTSQGCADAGLCYSPMESSVKLVAAGPVSQVSPAVSPSNNASSAGKLASAISAAQTSLPSQNSALSSNAAVPGTAPGNATVIAVPNLVVESLPTAPPPAPVKKVEKPSQAVEDEGGKIEAALKSGNLLVILPMFFLLGLGLSLTPCVFPMVPILSYIIVGEGAAVTRMRGFILALAYVFGMALVYAMLGVASGLAGEGFAAALQNPWVLGAFGLLLAGLSLAMFDVYQLQMPAAIQMRLLKSSERQSRGKLFGVFVMGALSALIVGPCVTAPLVGALLYINLTRDAVLGGQALFVMALGMGIPLLAMGISAGSLLPKAGAWMDGVKKFFGVAMLGAAIWLVSPVLPASLQMLAWGILAIGYGVHLLHGAWFAKTVGTLCLILGAMQLLGLASNGRDPLAPLGHLALGKSSGVTAQSSGKAQEEVHFQRVKTVTELDAVLAANRGKVVMLDFYADWCVSCKEMEKFTFPAPAVKEKMAQMLLLQVDVTANDAADKEMLKRFKLFGPPGIIFFDVQGRELENRRVIGYQNAERFAASLAAVL